MKLLLFAGIFHVFCSTTISGAPQNGQQNERVKLNLLNLIDDIQLLIFEQLNVIDLISMAQTNSNFFYFSQRVLRQKLARKEMIFRNPYVDEDAEKHVKEFDDRIEIQHWPTIKKMLSLFGHLIRKIEIVHRYKLTPEQSSEFFALINSHCTNTLLQMRIINIAFNDIFTELKSPFKKLAYLALSGEYLKFDKSNFAFNRSFPSVRSIHMDSGKILDLGLCEQNLQYLNELSTENQDNDHRSAVIKFIKNHPLIKSLKLKYVDPSLLEFVVDELKQLENLEIHHYNQDDDDDDWNELSFEFEHLKRLSVYMAMPKNLTFHTLEEFEIVSFLRDPNLIDQVLEFKQNLKKLHLRTPLDNKDILKLVNAKLNLIEMTISIGSAIEFNYIVKLLNNSEDLQKMFIVSESVQFRQLTIKAFKEGRFKYRFNWSISEINNLIVLERQ